MMWPTGSLSYETNAKNKNSLSAHHREKKLNINKNW